MGRENKLPKLTTTKAIGREMGVLLNELNNTGAKTEHISVKNLHQFGGGTYPGPNPRYNNLTQYHVDFVVDPADVEMKINEFSCKYLEPAAVVLHRKVEENLMQYSTMGLEIPKGDVVAWQESYNGINFRFVAGVFKASNLWKDFQFNSDIYDISTDTFLRKVACVLVYRFDVLCSKKVFPDA